MKLAKFLLLLTFALSASPAFAQKIQLRESPGDNNPLELLRDAEQALQGEVARICGSDLPQSLRSVSITVASGNGGRGCARVNPLGKLSGDGAGATDPAVWVRCYSSFAVDAEVDCRAPLK